MLKCFIPLCQQNTTCSRIALSETINNNIFFSLVSFCSFGGRRCRSRVAHMSDRWSPFKQSGSSCLPHRISSDQTVEKGGCSRIRGVADSRTPANAIPELYQRKGTDNLVADGSPNEHTDNGGGSQCRKSSRLGIYWAKCVPHNTRTH